MVTSTSKYAYIDCDPNLCVGCQLCEYICSFTKTGEYNSYRSRIRTVYRAIEREVAHVVERPVYRDCSVDADGLRLWSAANRGDPTPDAAGRAGR